LKRRAARVLLSGFVLTVAVSGLTACRTSPNVAAYVGDEQVSVTELENAVARRLENPELADFAAAQGDEFRRQVLSLLVLGEVHDAAAERYGVQVDDDDVRRRLEALLAGRDEDREYSQLATQRGLGRADVFENVRQQLVSKEIAESEGEWEAPTEADLQERYAEVREDLAEVSFGYITVPDEPTATAVLAQLAADPAAYPAVAAQYPGQLTLPALETSSPADLPPELAQQIAATEPNTGFSIPTEAGVAVVFVEGPVYPPFEDVRTELEEEAFSAAAAAGGKLVQAVREDIGVTVNPRYGVLEKGQLVPGTGGAVEILGEGGGDEPAGAGAPGN
jgi:peptidyl-prolyl cis-trans isomerase SurA